MPDMTPVANQIIPPNPQAGINTFSALLQLQQQRQALQTGQYQQQSAQAGATIAQQTAKENQALAQLISDPVGHGIANEDGTPTEKAKNIYMQAAPTTWAKHYDDLVSTAQRKVEFNSTVNNLRTSERGEIASNIAGAAAGAQSPQDITDSLDALVESKKGTAVYDDYKKLADLTKKQLDSIDKHSQGKNPAPAGQEPWRTASLNIGRSVLPPAATVGPGGLATPQTGTMDNGGGIQPGTVAPAIQGGGFTPSGPQIQKTPAPGYTVGPNGQILRTGPNGISIAPSSAPTNTVQAPGSAPNQSRPAPVRTAEQDAPPPNAPRAVQDAYLKATQDANTHVETVRSADENYGNNKAISSAIRHLAADSSTGPGTQTWNRFMAGLGTNAGNNAQELGAFLDRQAATVRGQMGLPGTNAGAEDAKMIAGNTNYTPKVIQDKNDYTEALTEGLHAYRKGLDRVAGFGGQASPQAVNQFKSAWVDNFDPNVFKGELAYKRSKKEGDAFVASLDPKEAASLAAKRKALQQLSSGQLPQ